MKALHMAILDSILDRSYDFRAGIALALFDLTRELTGVFLRGGKMFEISGNAREMIMDLGSQSTIV